MPVWAAILAAFLPTMLLVFVGLIRLEGRIAHLEGKVDAILAIMAGKSPIPAVLGAAASPIAVEGRRSL